MPGTAGRKTPPGLHQQLGIGAGEQLHPIAVLGIGGLLGVLDLRRPGLGSQESDKEGSGIGGLPLGLRKTPGGAGGVADVVEIKVAYRDAGKVFEREGSAGGQGGGTAARACATSASRLKLPLATRIGQTTLKMSKLIVLEARQCEPGATAQEIPE